jgi:hypothetical protein
MSNVPNIKRKFNGHVFTLGLETQTKARAEKMKDGWKGLGWKARITTHKGEYKYRVWYRKETY